MMIVIFMFSEQDRTKSTNTSDKVTEIITNITTDKNVDKNKQEEINKKMRLIVRKTAHFTAYFILGGLAYIVLYQANLINKEKLLLLALIFTLTYSISDEIHQLFVSGRSASIKDILIDNIGALFGIYIIKLTNKKLDFLSKI